MFFSVPQYIMHDHIEVLVEGDFDLLDRELEKYHLMDRSNQEEIDHS